MKKVSPTRIYLCVQDVANITGKSTRHAKRVMAAIRRSFGKVPYTPITIDEFCDFTGIKEERVKAFLE